MKTVFTLFLLMISLPAYSDCKFSGKQYPEGTIINGYVCNAEGKWENQTT